MCFCHEVIHLACCLIDDRDCENVMASEVYNCLKTHAASNPSFHTKTALIVLSDLRSSTRLTAGTAMMFTSEKTRRRLHERKTEHFKALTKCDHLSAIADHIITTGHNIKWDHFEIPASGKTDLHCKIKETLFIQELQPSLNANVGSERNTLLHEIFATR